MAVGSPLANYIFFLNLIPCSCGLKIEEIFAVATATGKAKAKQKADQRALQQFAGTRRTQAAQARAAKSKSAREDTRQKKKRPDPKFARSDSLGAPDLA
jgi:hypothetical protein